MLRKLKNIFLTIKNNYEFRTLIFSFFSLLLDVFFIIFYIVMSMCYYSPWNSCLIIYYSILTGLRGAIVVPLLKNKHLEEKNDLRFIECHKICGIIFILLAFLLCAMIVQIITKAKTFAYPLFIIYSIAGYTLIRICTAIYNFFKVRKNSFFSIRTLKYINVSSAFVSFLSLQSICLDTFSENVNKSVFNAVTGFIICLLIVIIGVFMIVVSNRTKKKIIKQQNLK